MYHYSAQFNQDFPALGNYFAGYQAFRQKQQFNLGVLEPEISIPIFSYDNVDRINTCSSKIVIIDSLHEGHYTSSNFYHLYDKSKHYVIFTNWFDRKKMPLPIDYTLVWHNYFLFDIARQYQNYNSWYFYTDKTYNFEYPKSCLFAHISNSTRLPRDILKDKFIQQLDVNNFIFRYQGIDYGKNINGVDVVASGADIVSQFNNHIQRCPGIDSNVYWRTISNNVYNMAYFQLVIESYFDKVYHGGFFVTEKTVKPLLTGQPFVIAAVPGYLQYLKSLGFYTFDSLWDESYDQETNDHTRLDMIADLCVKLQDFDWNANRKKIQRICNFNRLNFLNLSQLAEQEFLHYQNTLKNLSVIE